MKKYLPKARQVLRERRLPWAIRKRLSIEYCIMVLTKAMFRLVITTKPIKSYNESDYEICTLLDRGNVYPYLVAIKSFWAYSPVRCRITVVSDGSLQNQEKSLLYNHIKGVNIYEPFDIQSAGNDILLAIKSARDAYHTVRKTWDIYHAINSRRIVFLDSDVIFLNKLDEWIFDINKERQMIYNRDHDHSQCDPLFYLTEEFIGERHLSITRKISDLNCGFMIFSSEAFKMDLILEYIHFLYKRSLFHTVMEQDCWNIIASTIPCVAMPDTYVVGDYGERFIKRLQRKDLRSVHFVGGIRYKNFRYMTYAFEFMKRFKRGSI